MPLGWAGRAVALALCQEDPKPPQAVGIVGIFVQNTTPNLVDKPGAAV